MTALSSPRQAEQLACTLVVRDGNGGTITVMKAPANTPATSVTNNNCHRITLILRVVPPNCQVPSNDDNTLHLAKTAPDRATHEDKSRAMQAWRLPFPDSPYKNCLGN